MASSRGTVMELGIGPTVTAGARCSLAWVAAAAALHEVLSACACGSAASLLCDRGSVVRRRHTGPRRRRAVSDACAIFGAPVAAGLIIQLLVGSKILDVDTNVKTDRDLMCAPPAAGSCSVGAWIVLHAAVVLHYLARQSDGCAHALLWPCRKTAEHVLGLLITVGQAIVYVLTGMYGEPSEVGAINGILIVLQVRGCAGWHGS